MDSLQNVLVEAASLNLSGILEATNGNAQQAVQHFRQAIQMLGEVNSGGLGSIQGEVGTLLGQRSVRSRQMSSPPKKFISFVRMP